jgi:hypothetical protein
MRQTDRLGVGGGGGVVGGKNLDKKAKKKKKLIYLTSQRSNLSDMKVIKSIQNRIPG